MNKIDILLATYNGEPFIEPQILSIIGQSFRDWRLVIHDDGSNDHTVEIIKHWQKIDSRIELIDDGIKCGGASGNFMHLLQFAKAGFIMFCDQDDIWLDNKIEIMFEAITKKSTDKPQVVYCNSYIWKPAEGIKGNAMLSFPQSIEHLLFLNGGMQGCASIFNKLALELMQQWKDECSMHDHLLHLIGLCIGETEYLPVSLMLYRNHERNVTGETSSKVWDFKRIIKNRATPVVDRKYYETKRNFLDQYHHLISNRDQKIISAYLLMPSKNLMQKIFLIFSNNFTHYGSKFNLIMKIIFRAYIN